jgi:hypothetical protein
MYKEYVRGSPVLMQQIRELAGKRLLCHCERNEDCHGDILIEVFIAVVQTAEGKQLIYVGAGRPDIRGRLSDWASPFTHGAHGSKEACMIKYMEWFTRGGAAQGNLREGLCEIRGRTLACDCEPGDPCHVDFLAAAASDETKSETANRSTTKRPPTLVVAALLGIAATRSVVGYDMPKSVPVRWPQEELDRCLRKLLPYEMTTKLRIPMLEDLVNCAPFTDYYEWREHNGLDTQMGCGPAS